MTLPQRWRKLGRVAHLSGEDVTMAMLPTAHPIDADRVRLYYGELDESSVARIASVDVSLANPTRALTVPRRAIDLGAIGDFDDNGMLPSCVLAGPDALYLLYVGFHLRKDIPYSMLAGLARSTDNGMTFERTSRAPLLPASDAERSVRSAAFVLPSDDAFRMWYLAGSDWISAHGRTLPTYGVATSRSQSMASWPPAGTICYSPGPGEIGFGRPWVIRVGAGFRLWQAVRTIAGYKTIIVADSADGESWQRHPNAVDLGSPIPGFDEDMVCQPAIVRGPDSAIMFYNGNGYGRTGIGVAVADAEVLG